MENIISIGVGLVFIIVYASDRFNTPATNRGSTTWARFYTGMTTYCALGTIAYFLFINYPAVLRLVIQSIDKEYAKRLPDWMMSSQSVPLLAALLLTVALPKIPLVAKLDEKVMKQLQYIAAIPRQERDLAGELSSAVFEANDERVIRRVKQLLSTRLEEEDIVFAKSAAPQYLWTKIATLIALLEGWEGHRAPARFVSLMPGEWQELKRRYDVLGLKAQTCFELVRDHLATPGSPRASRAVREYRKDFEEQAEELLKSLYRFISRGVLQTHLTHRARVAQLNELGFEAQIAAPLLSLDELVWLFLIATTAFVVGLALLGPGSGRMWTPILVTQLFLRSTMIAAIYVVAIWCAIYPKARWRFARRKAHALPPVAAYFLSGLMSMSSAALISIAFKSAMFFPHQGDALENVVATSPWLLMSFTTSFTVAWLCDNMPEPSGAARVRWLETGTQAVVGAVTGVAVWLLLGVTAATAPSVSVPPLGAVLGLCVFMGAAVGYCVPMWYRNGRMRETMG
jgi:hypothetical protein